MLQDLSNTQIYICPICFSSERFIITQYINNTARYTLSQSIYDKSNIKSYEIFTISPPVTCTNSALNNNLVLGTDNMTGEKSLLHKEQ